MKKTIFRVIAAAVLAAMLFTALPALAYTALGTVPQAAPLYEEPSTSSRVVGRVRDGGTVRLTAKTSDGSMYQVSVEKDGKTYKVYIAASAVTNIRQDKDSGYAGVPGGAAAAPGTVATSEPAGTYRGNVADNTSIYDSSNKLIANVKSGGSVTVLGRDSSGSRIYITVSYGRTYTGWVNAASISGITRDGHSIGVLELPVGSGEAGTGYTAYAQAQTGVSRDSTIYVRKTASDSVSGNLVKKITGARGAMFTILGQDATGRFLYASYSGCEGFVRAQDFTLQGSAAGAAAPGGANYTAFDKPRDAVSIDSTIIMRLTPDKSIEASNTAVKVKPARGVHFALLGETGDWYYAQYETYKGYVRRQDFALQDGPAAGAAAPGGANYTAFDQPKDAVSVDSTIIMRLTPDKSTAKSNTVVTIKPAKGRHFALLGETGDWYYAQYETYKGYVRRRDFALGAGTAGTPQGTSLSTTTSGAIAGVGHGGADEKWGSITIPGAGTYPVYGNYANSSKNKYYYSQENLGEKGLGYIHTTTARGSQVTVMMGHNRRQSGTYFHNLHHIQNALKGVNRCEYGKCKHPNIDRSIFGVTTMDVDWDGFHKWDIVCLYETPRGSSSSVLYFNYQPWNSSTEAYVDFQLKNARNPDLKGWVNNGVSCNDPNGRYIMLIGCGDLYESDRNATSKIYVLLKARS